MKKTVHIVCFDVPYPVDHGGFFDLFYKIKALHEQGIAIILHCFQYGRDQQDILSHYCKDVFYYERFTGLKSFSFKLPYIVKSRINKKLFNNLSADHFPIILEGTHCTYWLYKNLLSQRKIIYRLHNIEHIYYKQLFYTEKNFLKKLYYLWESLLLKNYERKAALQASVVLPVSENDVVKFKHFCPKANIQYVPVFLPYQKVETKEGSGNYCLYHGNLSVAENEQVAIWLVKNVSEKINLSLIIAGRQPSHHLTRIVQQYKNVQLIADPADEEMQRLIQNAHINLIFSFNATGIKLKLINALFNGRHCLVNTAAVIGTDLEQYCHKAESAKQVQEVVNQLQYRAFEIQEIQKREKAILALFNNQLNAQKLSAWLY